MCDAKGTSDLTCYALRTAVLHHRSATNHFQVTDLRQARQKSPWMPSAKKAFFLSSLKFSRAGPRSTFLETWKLQCVAVGANNSLVRRRRWRPGPSRAPLGATVGGAGALPPSLPDTVPGQLGMPGQIEAAPRDRSRAAGAKAESLPGELSARPGVQSAGCGREVDSPQPAHTNSVAPDQINVRTRVQCAPVRLGSFRTRQSPGVPAKPV